MRCGKFRNLASLCLDRRLPLEVQAQFDSHRRDCPACAGYLDQVERCCREAKNLTEVSPSPGFDEAVITAMTRPAPAYEVAAPQPSAFRLLSVRSAVAGLIIGIAIGVAADIALRAKAGGGPAGGGKTATTGSELPDWGSDVRLSAGDPTGNVEQARTGIGGFLQASEVVGSGISALPWNDPLSSGMLLGSLAHRMEMDSKIDEAEKARPVLSQYKPSASGILTDLIRDQRDILLSLRAPESLSPDAVANLRAKALETLGNIQRTRDEFDVSTVTGFAPNGIFLSPPSEPKNDFEALAGAMVREVRGDFDGAVRIYMSFPERFPSSPWKSLMVGRAVRVGRQLGRDDAVVRFLQSIDQVIRPGELDPFTVMQIQNVLNLLEVEKSTRVSIRVKISELGAVQQPERPAILKLVRVGSQEIRVDPGNAGLAHSLWHSLRGKKGWTCQRSTVFDNGTARVDRTIFERDGENSPDIENLLGKLLAGAGVGTDLAAIRKIEFE